MRKNWESWGKTEKVDEKLRKLMKNWESWGKSEKVEEKLRKLRKCDLPTDQRTDRQTWVGARDACASKKKRKKECGIELRSNNQMEEHMTGSSSHLVLVINGKRAWDETTNTTPNIPNMPTNKIYFLRTDNGHCN